MYTVSRCGFKQIKHFVECLVVSRSICAVVIQGMIIIRLSITIVIRPIIVRININSILSTVDLVWITIERIATSVSVKSISVWIISITITIQIPISIVISVAILAVGIVGIRIPIAIPTGRSGVLVVVTIITIRIITTTIIITILLSFIPDAITQLVKLRSLIVVDISIPVLIVRLINCTVCKRPIAFSDFIQELLIFTPHFNRRH